MSEINDIKKLSPDERIKKLKELVDKRNKEIDERNKEIKEAEELKKQAEKDDADERLRQQIKVPNIEEVDIANLFKKKEEDLETKASSAPRDELEQVQSEAMYKLTSQTPTNEIYQNVVNLYTQVRESGYVDPTMAQQAAGVQYAINEKLESSDYSPGEDIVSQANTAKKIADKILSLYTGGVKKQDGI
jgi:hypothetical protein